MVNKTAGALLGLAAALGVAFAAWRLSAWPIDAGTTALLADLQAGLVVGLYVFIGALAVFLFGYLASFDSRSQRRPLLFIAIALALSAFGGGVLAHEALVAFNLTLAKRVEFTPMVVALCFGAAAIPVALLLLFEAINRMVWTRLAASFDQREIAGMALVANRMALLFKPGQTGMLRSVAIARFRKGARADALETIQSLYDSGKRDADILECLCKAASEQRDMPRYLGYLRELHTLLPDEEQIRDILIEELINQRHFDESLALLEKSGVPQTEEALERYARILLEEGRLDQATAVSADLGEIEGIPFRRSQALLREVLTRAAECVAALNVLAAQADRMALRDQKIRWLEKSYGANSRQTDVRRELLVIYRELGQTPRLEDLLGDHVTENPKDWDAHMELAEVFHQNEKTAEALARLEPFSKSGELGPRAALLEARIRIEARDFEPAREAALRVPGISGATPAQVAEAESILVRIEKALLSDEIVSMLDRARQEPTNLQLQLDAITRLAEGGHADKVTRLADDIVTAFPQSRPKVAAALQAAVDHGEVPFALLNMLADLYAAESDYARTLSIVQVMAARSMDHVATLREGAQKILRRVPHHLPTLKLLGDAYLDAARFTEMIHSYSLYLSHGGEQDPLIIRAMAKAYLALDDYGNARRFVAQLLAQNPADVILLKLVLPIALKADAPADAAEYLAMLEAAEPREPELKRLRPRVHAAVQADRMAALQKKLDAGEGGAELLEQLGDVARDLENFADAITYYQKSTRDKTDERRVRRSKIKLSLSYMRKRLDDLATETLREVTISVDEEPAELKLQMDLLYEIGELLYEQHRYDKAMQVFKELCKIDAGYRDVLKRVETLKK